MNIFTRQKGTGLLELKQDDRDFSLGKMFGQAILKDIPDSYIVKDPIPEVKDQKATDFCSAYASTSSSEKQEGIKLSPEYQFNATKRISGQPEKWGATLRDAMKSFTEYGSVEQSRVDLFMENNGFGKYDRDMIVNFSSWEDLDFFARKHKKESYFKVDGSYDHFDNIRSAIWKHKKEQSTVVCGILWRIDWNRLDTGIVKDKSNKDGFGHAFEIIGWKQIDKKTYLVARLSNGLNFGDNGTYYLPRNIVNSEMERYGSFMFKDMKREEVDFLIENNLSKESMTITVFIMRLLSAIKEIFKAWYN